MKIKTLYIIPLVYAFLFVHDATAQTEFFKNQRYLHLKVENEWIISDSLTILPSSVLIRQVSGDTLAHDDFEIINSSIRIKSGKVASMYGDSLLISYSVLSMDLGKNYSRFDSASLAATDGVLKPWKPETGQKTTGIIESQELDYDGSFSRGFSVGNRQSLVMNSNFNLQMSGNIGQGIEIQAVLSDANIPVQAEGNTYQLNEFDRVFIRLSKEELSLSAGDLEIKNAPGYFSRYHKKIKGIGFAGTWNTGKNNPWKNEAGYAVSKGKFARYSLDVQEGNQGPYRLRGSGNEQYLIILSGTEKIYYDGILLKRGRDFDYAIDYNTAELTFSVNRLISRDSRIIVEFEYVDINYIRSVQNLSTSFTTPRSNVTLQVFNEQDSKNLQAGAELDSLSYAILKNSGDNPDKLVRNGIVRQIAENSSQDQVFYRKVFESVIQDSILVYTDHQDSIKFSAYFTDVGQGKGSYAISEKSTVNGRVYIWVGPDKGRYEPVIRLKAPEQNTLISLGGYHHFSPEFSLNSELSMSKQDLNRFSTEDSEDDLGLAAHFQLRYDKKWQDKSSPETKDIAQLQAAVSYEITGRNFRPLNPYREVEFSRNWNIAQPPEQTPEHLVGSLVVLKKGANQLSYELSSLSRPGVFSGFRHIPGIEMSLKKFIFNAKADLLLTQAPGERTSFMKPALGVRFNGKNSFGLLFNQEKNRIQIPDNDSLNTRSFAFDNYRFFWDFKNEKTVSTQFFVNYREDFLPRHSNLVKNHNALDIGMKGFWTNTEKSRLDYNINYRQLTVSQSPVNPSVKSTGTLLGNLVHRFISTNDFLHLNSRAEVISGQEPKAEYIFIELTNPGQGNYIWIDSNGDGIRQKGEFELSPFGDNANFIKIAQYNHTFIRVNSSSFYHDFQLNPEKILRPERNGFFSHQLRKISLLGNFRIDQKIREDSKGGFGLPVRFNPADSILVGLNMISHITLYYNKANPVYDIRIESGNVHSTNVQIDGLVRLGGHRNMIKARFSGLKNTDLLTGGAIGNSEYEAELYQNKNFDIDYTELEQELRYRVSRGLGIQGKYTFIQKKNKISGQESLTGSKLDVKVNIRNMNQFNIAAGVSYSFLKYDGQPNTSVELAMMEGLKDGSNYQWTMQLSRKMAANVEMNFAYNGRKTGELKPVHIGSIQAKARF